MEDQERAFYHNMIMQLLQYNMQMVNNLVGQNKLPPIPQSFTMPIPPPPYPSFGLPPRHPPSPISFGPPPMASGDPKKLENMWKEYLMSMGKIMGQNFSNED